MRFVAIVCLSFVPFGVGYVELPGEVKVETRLTESDPAALTHGMEMELVEGIHRRLQF